MQKHAALISFLLGIALGVVIGAEWILLAVSHRVQDPIKEVDYE